MFERADVRCPACPTPVPAVAGEIVVSRWVDAFNARDLPGMLRCLDADVRFRPLRLGGLSGSYRGHDGVSEWFARLRLRDEHRILVAEVQSVGGDRVSVIGSLCLGADPAIAPFCGLHRLQEGLIVSAHHYLTDPDMIERLGLIP